MFLSRFIAPIAAKQGAQKQIEYEERVAGDSGECLTDSLPNGEISAAVKNTESTDDILLCNKSGDGCNSCLPVAPAERCEERSDKAADFSKDGELDLVLREHSEAGVGEAEVGGEPNKDSREQDYCTCLLNE